MACEKHKWKGSGECPDCRVEAEQKLLSRDIAALASVVTAFAMLGVDGYPVPSSADVAAKAYELADALLAHREKVNR